MINNNLGLAVDQDQNEFTAFLVKILRPKDKLDFDNKISLLDKDLIEELYRLFKSYKNLAIMAKEGTKLDYLRLLKGECPEGFEKFMLGGCIKCKKKMVEKPLKESMGGSIKNRFKKGPLDSNSASTTDPKPNKLQKKAFKHLYGGVIKRF